MKYYIENKRKTRTRSFHANKVKDSELHNKTKSLHSIRQSWCFCAFSMIKFKKFKPFGHLIMKKTIWLAALLLTACTGASNITSEQVSMRVASPAFMVKRQVPAGPFALTAFERMHERFADANVYIEDDGFEEDLPRESGNPTPSNPVALHLATKDSAENLVYLARPCQFTGMLDKETECNAQYWMNNRFSDTVIEAYNDALDEIKARYDIKQFNLIGHGGGGAIATILAAQRGDVISLRTVAANLDHITYSHHNEIGLLDGSLNPADYAAKLREMPQVHYVGGQDKIVPPAVLESYLGKLEPSECEYYELVQEAEHSTGWVDKWPELLKRKPACTIIRSSGYMDDRPAEFPARQEPIYRPREKDIDKSWPQK